MKPWVRVAVQISLQLHIPPWQPSPRIQHISCCMMCIRLNVPMRITKLFLRWAPHLFPLMLTRCQLSEGHLRMNTSPTHIPVRNSNTITVAMAATRSILNLTSSACMLSSAASSSRSTVSACRGMCCKSVSRYDCCTTVEYAGGTSRG